MNHHPKTDKSCTTCCHVGRSTVKDVCLDCAAEADEDNEHPEWHPRTNLTVSREIEENIK